MFRYFLIFYFLIFVNSSTGFSVACFTPVSLFMFFLGLVKSVTENVTLSVNVTSFRASPTLSLIGERAEEMICLSTDVCILLSSGPMPEKVCFMLG